MLIDCETCVARDVACGDCVVTMLFSLPGQIVELDDEERSAVRNLAAGGLVSPLRLVAPPRDRHTA